MLQHRGNDLRVASSREPWFLHCYRTITIVLYCCYYIIIRVVVVLYCCEYEILPGPLQLHLHNNTYNRNANYNSNRSRGNNNEPWTSSPIAQKAVHPRAVPPLPALEALAGPRPRPTGGIGVDKSACRRTRRPRPQSAPARGLHWQFET